MQNANKGTNGVNRQYSQVQGNRGAQMNPNKKSKKGRMKAILGWLSLFIEVENAEQHSC